MIMKEKKMTMIKNIRKCDNNYKNTRESNNQDWKHNQKKKKNYGYDEKGDDHV